MLPVLRGKILRPETVHASELIIAVERPLLLDKMPHIPVPVSAADRKKPRFRSPPPFAPPVYRGVSSLIPHALLDAGPLGSQQELRSG